MNTRDDMAPAALLASPGDSEPSDRLGLTLRQLSPSASELSSLTLREKTPSVPIMEIGGRFVSAGGKDAGNLPRAHYKSKLSPLRYRLRKVALPIVEWEADFIAAIQNRMRHPWLDFYFAWTANLALHTFYVLLFPIPVWFGSLLVLRDMIYSVGFGIYCTGFLKDWLCLPRPRSPPLHRITMLSYTTEEYGFPSSHLANATLMTLIFLYRVIKYGQDWLNLAWYSAMAGLFVYYASLIVGRVYCGMHGFFDILLGVFVGWLVFAFRHYFGETWDYFLFYYLPLGLLSVVLVTAICCALIHVYPEPADDCPCFDDAVAFVGVVIGMDITHNLTVRTDYLARLNRFQDPYLMFYSYEQLGLLWSFMRVVVGVGGVALWKAVAKPVVFAILVPIYKWLQVWIPRANYKLVAHSRAKNTHIRRQLALNIGGEEMEFLHDVTLHPHDQVGAPCKAGVFKPRYDVEIVGRLIIYAGIPIMAVWGFIFTSKYTGVACIDFSLS